MKRILRNSLELLMLATIAITQPIFDMYGKNLPIFAAAKVSKYEIAFFIFLVAVVPTVVAVVIENIIFAINKRAGQVVHRIFLSLFGFLFGLALLRQIGVSLDVVTYALALGISGLIVMGLIRSSLVKAFATYLSALAPLLTVMFVIQIQPALTSSNSKLPPVVALASAPPVVLIVFDESPLFALLDADGKINSTRFPGFSKLASLATWHRNATAVSQQTFQAVPAIFTSNIPKIGDLPFLSDHPNNIFTMLQKTYPINGYESVTSLCPRNVCASAYPTDLERLYLPRLKSFLSDALVVYGHRVLPEKTRSQLPSVGQSWGGFAKSDTTTVVEGADEPANAKFDLTREGGPFFQFRMMNEAADRMISAKTPTATVMHLTMPHRPWFMSPSLQQYHGPPFLGDLNPSVGDRPKDYFQRYLYQLAAVDSMVNNLITRMQNAGLWDKSLVIVTADHGISFEPGLMQRATDFTNAGQVTDLFTIPMFVKMPHQAAGKIDDCAVTNLDLLPTVLDVTGVTTQAHLDGSSLVGACPSRALRPMTTPKESRMLESSFDLVRARSDRYAQWLPREGPVQRIAGELSAQEILGSTIKTVPSTGAVATWTSAFSSQFDDVKPGITELAPTFIFGTIDVREKIPETTDGLVLIDGKVAGVINELSGAAPGEIDYQVLLDYTLLTPGKHVPTLVLRHRVGLTTQYELVGPLG
jgi:hypothetical protein